MYVLILNKRWICVDLLDKAVMSYDEAEELRKQRQDLKSVESLDVYELVDADNTTDDMHVVLQQTDPTKVEFNTVIRGSTLTSGHIRLYGNRLKRLEPIGSLF